MCSSDLPYFLKGDSEILYSPKEVSGITSDVCIYNLNNKTQKKASNIKGLEEYYPITRDDTSFYFSRWTDQKDHHDQLWMGFLNGSNPVCLPFNKKGFDCSDACTINDEFVLFSKTNLKGDYDLCVSSVFSKQIWSLSEYYKFLNTAKNELGASYHK